MLKERVSVYIDGFNLYHAIDKINKPHLKWVNLKKLASLLINQTQQRIVSVKYFSALANHYSGTAKVHRLLRHRTYVKALRAKGVEVHLGNFAKREMIYGDGSGRYKARWRRFEEKQTDVSIAVQLIHDAHIDLFDRALIISLDTDMLPAFRLLLCAFPAKEIVCMAPPERPHHREIQNLGIGLGVIKTSQLEKSLFGATVRAHGEVIARRPAAYNPPV